jgi:seryl-tRNA synthetase
MAPPYAWDAIEREDWKYDLPKPKHMAEGEFKSSPPTHPSFTSSTAHPSPGARDHRHDRVDAIHKEIAELRKKVAELNHQSQQLTQAGKDSLSQRPAYDPQSAVRIGEALGDYPHTPGPADSAGGMTWVNNLEKPREQPLGLRKKTSRDYRQIRKSDSERLQVQRQHDQGRRHHAQPPPQSAQLIGVHQQIDQKQKQIDSLNDELEGLLRQIKQSQPHHESYRLTSNNLPRLSLLLK